MSVAYWATQQFDGLFENRLIMSIKKSLLKKGSVKTIYNGKSRPQWAEETKLKKQGFG